MAHGLGGSTPAARHALFLLRELQTREHKARALGLDWEHVSLLAMARSCTTTMTTLEALDAVMLEEVKRQCSP